MPSLLLPFAEFGGRRNRQADRAADHQRGRLGYLILIALFYRGVLPAAMQP